MKKYRRPAHLTGRTALFFKGALKGILSSPFFKGGPRGISLLLLIPLLIFLLASPAAAAPPSKPRLAGQWNLTGGATGAVDNLSIINFIDHSILFVVYDDATNKMLYFYEFEGGSTDVEDSPDVIRADDGHGTHTGAGNAATLTDSAQSWTVDALIGFSVYNVTDASSCTITDNDATTVTCTLSGGTDDDWDASDDYVIQGVWRSIDSFYLRPSVTPGRSYYDSDAGDGDRSGRVYVNCVDTTSGSEDCEYFVQLQIGGTADTTVLQVDCDTSGNCSVNLAPQGTGVLQVGGSQIDSDDLADTASIAMLDEAETIAGNWVNTANPWAENEVVSTVVVESDVDDTPANAATTDPVSSNWAYDHVNDADQHGEYVLESLFDANTLLKADSDNTPAALTVGEQTLVGRITAGSITALTPTQVRTLINVEDGAAGNQNANEVSIWDVGEYYSSDYVEGALGEVGAAMALNTTHRTSDGSDHGHIDQDVTTSGTPTFTSATVDTEVYGVGWDADNSAPTKDAVYDKIETLGGGGTVDTSGTPVANDFAKFTDADTIEGRSYAETKSDLSLDSVENTAISTWAGSANLTTVGALTSGSLGAGFTDVPVAQGGTGSSTAAGAASNLGLGTEDTPVFSALEVNGTVTLANDETIINSTDTEITFTSDGNEDLVLDLNTSVDNEIELTSTTGATQVEFTGLSIFSSTGYADFETCGDSPTTGTVTITDDCQSSGVFYNGDDDVIEFDLPAAAANKVFCFHGGTYDQIVTIDPDVSDTITLEGTTASAGEAIVSAGTAPEFICLHGNSAGNWMSWGSTGTWAEASP